MNTVKRINEVVRYYKRNKKKLNKVKNVQKINPLTPPRDGVRKVSSSSKLANVPSEEVARSTSTTSTDRSRGLSSKRSAKTWR